MRWTLQSKPEKEQVQKLQSELNIDQTIATLLIQRGITPNFKRFTQSLSYERYGQSCCSY